MSKRGQVETLKLVAGLVIVGIVVLMFFALYTRIASMFEKKDADAAQQNFEQLTEVVDGLLESERGFEATVIPFALTPDFTVVGYSSGAFAHPIKSDCKGKSDAFVPSQCGSSSCLCLYKSKSSFNDASTKDKDVAVCRRFRENIVFLADYEAGLKGSFNGDKIPFVQRELPSAYYTGTGEYEFAFIYGECDSAWKTRPLYVEKYTAPDSDKTIVYFSVSDRRNAMEKAIKERAGQAVAPG